MLSDRPVKHPEALSRIVDGEAMVLVQVPAVTTIVLNEVATRVWELMDGHRDIKAISHCIAEEYEVAPEQAEADVEEVVADMQAKSMLATPDE
ncbi:MAG: PqqD family protein [Acidobacteriota bacterium]